MDSLTHSSQLEVKYVLSLLGGAVEMLGVLLSKVVPPYVRLHDIQ